MYWLNFRGCPAQPAIAVLVMGLLDVSWAFKLQGEVVTARARALSLTPRRKGGRKRPSKKDNRRQTDVFNHLGSRFGSHDCQDWGPAASDNYRQLSTSDNCFQSGTIQTAAKCLEDIGKHRSSTYVPNSGTRRVRHYLGKKNKVAKTTSISDGQNTDIIIV